MIERPIRVLELRSVRGTGGGPEKTILRGTARTDRRRFEITVCYLRDARDTVFSIDRKAAGLPIDYTEVIERHSFDPAIWPRLRQIVRDRSIDIVHAHDYKTNVLAWLLARSDRVVPLSTAHGWNGRTRRELVLYYPLDKRLLSLFPKVIVVSDRMKRELIRCGAKPERVVTVHNGIDHLEFRRNRSRSAAIRASLGITPDQFVVGAVGRLEVEKRFELLIDAVAELNRERRNLRLLIVGEGSLKSALSQQIAARGVSASCTLLGSREDVAALHHAFDLFVQSSDTEGTPNCVLEAMALETPIVATAVGGTPEICRDGVDALLVHSGSADVLKTAIENVIEDAGAAARRVASARARVETDLSFERRMQKVEAVYLSLLGQSGDIAPAALATERT